jgi:hypothetical protein
MSHYTSNAQGFLLGLGVRRHVTTLCGLVLDEAKDKGSPNTGSRATCPECRRKNGER